MSAWRWLGCAALICALAGCGDDDSGGGDDSPVLTKDDASVAKDGGADADVEMMKPPKRTRDGGNLMRDASAKDAEPDAPFDPFAYDAEYQDPGDFDAGPPPDDWSCPKALWADGYCDCGCSARDIDCQQFSCTDPGCLLESCSACFAKNGSWQPCSAPPSVDDWTCDDTLRSDSLCDCGCGIPDPDCGGQGCSEPGCRKAKCQTRHGCDPGLTTDISDDCASVNPSVLQNKWSCPWDHYGSGDGCDCGCGALDPDCGGLGCTSPRCFDSTCDSCFDQDGRPYSCDAAEAGWDDELIDATQAKDPSMCNSLHFDANDGCDCGCGGTDPDCGNNGCEAPGCNDDACDRCTDVNTLQSVGCAPAEWLSAGCDAKHYGTGDGCDCGCGWKDPDCDDDGYCTTAGCQDGDACDLCWDNGGVTDAPAAAVTCPGWTCTNDAFTDGDCDCGCGKTDPDCRDANRQGCTDEDCSTEACEVCDDNGERVQCGGEWSDAWPFKFYGLDGLCDCGAGAPDPDCGKNEGCSEPGCLAEGCEVCHTTNQLAVCFEWTCSSKSFGKDDGCDCGCGAPDPDCETGKGCVEPGCKTTEPECDTCHDPYGRAVECP